MSASPALPGSPGTVATAASGVPSSAVTAAAAASGARDERGVGAWTRLVVASLARTLLFSLVGALLWTAVPTLFGWQTTTVMSDSMAPRLFAGDVVVTAPVAAADIQLGKVVLVDDPDHAGRLRLHRLVELTDDGMLITRGDANAQADSTPVTAEAVHGVAVLRAPYVGAVFVWAGQGRWALVAAGVLAVLALLVLAGIDASLRRYSAEELDRHIRPRRRRPSRAGAIAGASALATVAVLVLTNGAHAAFAATTVASGSSLASAADYACWSTATAADSPFFSYRFDEAAGTSAADSSGNGRVGILQSGATRLAGSCLKNDSPSLRLGGTAAAFVPVAPGAAATAASGEYTMEAWVRTSSTTGGRILGFGSSATGTSTTSDRVLYVTADGKLIAGVGSAKVTATSPASYNDGAWHHVVVVYNAGVLGILLPSMTLYVDGVAVSAAAGLLTGTSSYSGWWRVGADSLAGWPSAPTTALSGSVDNVAAYSTKLTAAQVSAHFASGH